MELDEINTELTELNARLPNVIGRPCEVYSRIVGYYRPIHNWNVGKAQEFSERVEFALPELKI